MSFDNIVLIFQTAVFSIYVGKCILYSALLLNETPYSTQILQGLYVESQEQEGFQSLILAEEPERRYYPSKSDFEWESIPSRPLPLRISLPPAPRRHRPALQKKLLR